ncbi:MAG: hypothetical protein QOI24_2008 [Acidobacteriota bacterium]|jgi:hypothetical protein|nr:hypothetical protein [Acidobacteriota bacterium]
MKPAERLLAHFDAIGGSEAAFRTVSPPGAMPALHVAIYRDAPEPGAITGFSFGLSLVHPVDGPPDVHRELMVAMLDDDESWALAAGFVAYELREQCSFVCGDTINFREQISPRSAMNSFLVTHPLLLPPNAREVDIGVRRVRLVQFIPLYEEERIRLADRAAQAPFLRAFSPRELMNPFRASYRP